MAKKQKNVFNVFAEAVGLYFSNFDKFIKYMTFPVLGQVAGLCLIFAITYFYTNNLPKILEKYPNLNTFSSLIVMSVLITLPGLAIFVKAFWEYIVAYGSINSMYENMSKSGRIYDFTAHTELIKRRTPSFVGLWLLLGVFSLLAILPPFWIICGIFAVYFVIVFQVFVFEPECSAISCFKRSLLLIKGKFAKTFILIMLAGGLTYILIPQIVLKLFELGGISAFISNSITPLVKMFPTVNFEQYGIAQVKYDDIAFLITETFIAQIIIQYTLPLRSVMWSIWYNECNKISVEPYNTNKSKKRPSEKLMENTRKKYSSKKKLDSNILKRAMEKEDD